MSEYRRLRPAFVFLHVTLGLMLGIGGATTAWHAIGPHPAHLVALGGLEAAAALLFLLPRTLRLGAVGLIASCGVAFLAHAAMSQWRGDLLVYIAAVLFVALHGSAYRAPPPEALGALTDSAVLPVQ
jgi:uncharacterized membrane protein YphA (DoxX/SURF4 family)